MIAGRIDCKSLLILATLGPLALASLAWGSRNALRDSGDLERRVQEVRLVAQRQSPYQDPDATYPPPAYPVFAALILPCGGSPLVVRLVWLVLNLGAAGGVLWLCLRHAGSGWSLSLQLAFVLIALASKPLRLALGMGQYALQPLLFMLAAYAAQERGKVGRAGAWTTLALIKPTLSLPFLSYLAARGRRPPWSGAVMVGLGLFGAAWLAMAGWLERSPVLLLEDWLRLARTQESAGSIDLPALRHATGLAIGGSSMAVTLAAWALGTILILWRRDRPAWSLLGFACFLAAVFTYHRPYDLVILFVPLAVCCQQVTGRSGGARVLSIALLGLFGAVLIAPSHPAVIDPALYERLVIPATYVLFAQSIWVLLSQPRRDIGSSGAANEKDPSP